MRRTKEEAEKTRSEILQAAAKIFAKNGLERTTLNDIAQTADVTRGAIYWHFKNKMEIFDELYDQLHRPFLDLILDDLEKDHDEPLKQLEDLCIKVFADLENDQEKRDLLHFFLFKCDYSNELSELQERHLEKQEEKQRIFSRYFQKAITKGKLDQDADPEILTQSLNTFLKGILHNTLTHPKDSKIRKNTPQLISLFLSNLR